MNWLENIERCAAKHGITVLGVWTDRWGHRSWAVFDAPSMDAFKKFELEPENMARVTFTSTETVLVTSAKETLDFFYDIRENGELNH